MNAATHLLFFGKTAIKDAQKLLSSSEDVLWAQVSNLFIDPVQGELSTNLPPASKMLAGVFVVTNQRILFVHNILGKRTIREIPLSSIRSIDSKSNYLLDFLRIRGISNMMITFGNIDIISHFRKAINDALEKRNAPQAAVPANSPDDNELSNSDVEQLQALKQLYDSGVLTAEEFAAKKAQILNL